MYRFRTLLKKQIDFRLLLHVRYHLHFLYMVCVGKNCCINFLDALPIPRKWLKDAALSDVDLIRQPFEKVLAEGPSFVGRFCFFNISMEKQRCKSRQGVDIH